MTYKVAQPQKEELHEGRNQRHCNVRNPFEGKIKESPKVNEVT